MAAHRKPARLISVADLARLQGVSKKTALRRLRRVSDAAGGVGLIKIGKRIYTTITLLAAVEPGLLESAEMLQSDVDSLKEWKARAHKKIMELSARVRALEAAQKGTGDGTA